MALDEQRERRQHDHPDRCEEPDAAGVGALAEGVGDARTGLAAEVRAKTALLSGPLQAAHELPDGGVYVTADGRVHGVDEARALSA